jgi:SAM-dependent methyltransferase
MTTGERETAWWESFYSGEWIDVQRQLRTEKETGPEVEFLERALRLQSGARLLDVPCGVGRHSLALAARGYDVTGADITEEFLEDARREAARQNLSVRLVHRDMRKLEWTAEFDGVCHMWGSFGYFADEENAAFLQSLARALKPGGRFVMDTHVTETLLSRLRQERDWRRVGDTLILEERRYDAASSRTYTEWIFVREGKISKYSASVRLYSYRELLGLLDSVGFVDIETYGSVNQEPFSLNSPRVYVVAQKA